MFRRRFQFDGYPDSEPWNDDVCSCSYPVEKFPRAEFNPELTRCRVRRTCSNCHRRLAVNKHEWEKALYGMITIEMKA
jgi:hypothetical protein